MVELVSVVGGESARCDVGWVDAAEAVVEVEVVVVAVVEVVVEVEMVGGEGTRCKRE